MNVWDIKVVPKRKKIPVIDMSGGEFGIQGFYVHWVRVKETERPF